MRGLIHSGGGSKAGYAVGVIYHLLGELKTEYHLFSGVSSGAINCAFLAQFSSGQEQEAANQLVALWSQLRTKDIFRHHFPFGPWHALWKTSLYDSGPLQQLLREHIKLDRIRASGKIVNVGAISLNSGKYTVFDQTSDHFIEAVIASASFPGMLAAVPFDGHLWSDGGVKQISPIKTAIDLGADELDIIITSPKNRIKRFIKHPTAIDIMRRAIDLSTDKILSNDLEKLEMYNRLATAGLTDKKYVKARIIRPENNLIEDLLDFDPVKIREMLQIGYDDACKIEHY